MGPKCNHTCILMRKFEGDPPRKKREDHVTVETEIGVMWPQAKKYQQLQDGEEAREDSPQSLWKHCIPADTFISDF